MREFSLTRWYNKLQIKKKLALRKARTFKVHRTMIAGVYNLKGEKREFSLTRWHNKE